MPGPSRSISKNIPDNEKCIICLMAPSGILKDFREKQQARDPAHIIERVMIAINNDGGLAVLLDIQKQSHILQDLPGESSELDNLV